jgi:hypothetical protein
MGCICSCESSNLKTRENIIKYLYNISVLEKLYQKDMQNIYSNKFHVFVKNETQSFFLLLFDDSREYLYKSKYNYVLLNTEDGRKLLLSNNNKESINLLLSCHEGCLLILKSRHKNYLCDTEFSKQWALYFNEDSRNVLISNNETRKLLLTTNEGCIIIFESKFKNMLFLNEFSLKWAAMYNDESRQILFDNKLYKNLANSNKGKILLYQKNIYDYFNNDDNLYFVLKEHNKTLITENLIDHIILLISQNYKFYFEENEKSLERFINLPFDDFKDIDRYTKYEYGGYNKLGYDKDGFLDFVLLRDIIKNDGRRRNVSHSVIAAIFFGLIDKTHPCHNYFYNEAVKYKRFFPYLMNYNIYSMLNNEEACNYLLKNEQYNKLLKTECG